MAEENRSGIITNLIMGTAALIILTIIVLVIVSTIDSANLLQATGGGTFTVDNETIGPVSDGDEILLDITNTPGWSGVSIINVTYDQNASPILVTNYTFDSTTAGFIFSNDGENSSFNDTAWNVTYTYTPPTPSTTAVKDMSGNFTGGIDNVSEKIPTILLIGAVVLLFGVLTLLIRQSRAMGIGGGESSSL